MKSTDALLFRLVEVVVLLIGLMARHSSCEITVTVVDVTAYSAVVRWQVAPPNPAVTGYRLRIQGEHTEKLAETINNATATSYAVKDLDDMRDYEACVDTIEPLNIMTDSGCDVFTTPIGTTTYVAIVSGVFLVLCFVTFGVLDFVVSQKRTGQMTQKEKNLLEEGWQTFKRNSKQKKKKKKKRAAPQKPRPNSSTIAVVEGAPSSDVVDETRT